MTQSMVQSPSQVNFENIVKYGTYYYPADKHYYNGTIVQCDYCLKSNLKSCIGYNTSDLCLTCASKIENGIFDSPFSRQPSIPVSTTRPTSCFPSSYHNISQNSERSNINNISSNNRSSFMRSRPVENYSYSEMDEGDQQM